MTPIAQLIAELLEGAREIEIDGTPSQVGPSADVIRHAAEALARQEELLAEAGKVVEPFAEVGTGLKPRAMAPGFYREDAWGRRECVLDVTFNDLEPFRAAARLSHKLKAAQ